MVSITAIAALTGTPVVTLQVHSEESKSAQIRAHSKKSLTRLGVGASAGVCVIAAVCHTVIDNESKGKEFRVEGSSNMFTFGPVTGSSMKVCGYLHRTDRPPVYKYVFWTCPCDLLNIGLMVSEILCMALRLLYRNQRSSDCQRNQIMWKNTQRA